MFSVSSSILTTNINKIIRVGSGHSSGHSSSRDSISSISSHMFMGRNPQVLIASKTRLRLRGHSLGSRRALSKFVSSTDLQWEMLRTGTIRQLKPIYRLFPLTKALE